MNQQDFQLIQSRRGFFRSCAGGIGTIALAQLLQRDGYACRVCNAKRQLQVHHRLYPAVLGTESVTDLTTLCGDCHGGHHGYVRPVPSPLPWKSGLWIGFVIGFILAYLIARFVFRSLP